MLESSSNIYHEKDPTHTHDLSNMAYALLEDGFTLPIPVEEISKLNPYAVIFRYDDTEIEIFTGRF